MNDERSPDMVGEDQLTGADFTRREETREGKPQNPRVLDDAICCA